MARLYVEDWSPEYGAPFESDADSLPSEEIVDTSVEVRGAWEPLPGRDDGVRRVAFVDGVQRIEGSLRYEDADRAVAGIATVYAVGATLWDRDARASTVRDIRVERLAIFGGGERPAFPEIPGLHYAVEAVEGTDVAALRSTLDTRRGQAETALLRTLVEDGCFVVADGRLHDLGPHDVVGYIKSHHRGYLAAPESRVIGALHAGERTPVFLIPGHTVNLGGGGRQFARYSWYVRLMDIAHGHSWSGIARVEAPEAIGVERARALADRTAALLPLAAMPLYLDARAPQNLVPIAALEKELRRWLGDDGLVRRALRAAVNGVPA